MVFIPRRPKPRVWLIALPLFSIFAAVAVSATFLADRSTITGSSAQSKQLAASGSILQSGRVVGIASGAKLASSVIEFAEIREAKNFDITREFVFNGYRLAIARIRLVRFPNADSTSEIDLEKVVAHIREQPNS